MYSDTQLQRQAVGLPRACLSLLILAMILVTARHSMGQGDFGRKFDPRLLEQAAREGYVEFLVVLADQADLRPAATLSTKIEKGRFVYEALRGKAAVTQAPIIRLLQSRGVEHRSYFIVNLIWVRANLEVALDLASRSDVARVEGNPRVRGVLAGPSAPADGVATASARSVEAGVADTNAPAVWALGFTGQGIVVGGQDTGYQWDHPALITQYRGWNGSIASHDFNWHDSIHSGGGTCGADSPVPCGDMNHGTHTMGTAVGDDGGSNQIGMAPGARWIGCRNMDQGYGTPATYIESFEFFLAPYPVGGTPAQGNPALAPDVTVNSWTCPPFEGCSFNTLLSAVQAQRAAGILTVVAAGNSGSSGCSSVEDPPAIYDESYSVGAYSVSSGNIASFSSRGPVTIDGSNRLKPDIAAPGTSVRSSVIGGGYAGGWSGTSMATPHVAGAVALLWSAHPALRADLDLTEQVLNDTALPVTSTSCSSTGVPNNVWGHGKLDILAAVQAVRAVSVSPTADARTAPGGSPVIYTMTVTNVGYLPDTLVLSPGASAFTTTVLGPVVGPLPAGASQQVSVLVQIPPTASAGAADQVIITVQSQNFAGASAVATLNTSVTTGAPALAITQPLGAGTPIVIANGSLLPGGEYFNIISLEPCPGGPGTGGLLGLCAGNPATLLLQLGLPLGAEPFHFLAPTATVQWGPYLAPAGLEVEAICIHIAGGISGVSPVSHLLVQ